jgi:hypothetical protein
MPNPGGLPGWLLLLLTTAAAAAAAPLRGDGRCAVLRPRECRLRKSILPNVDPQSESANTGNDTDAGT